MSGRQTLLAAPAALALVALLQGCAGKVTPDATGLPTMYLPLTTGSTTVDTAAARDMISAYRRNNGAAPLVIDPELQRLAETEAAAMAASDRPSKSQIGRAHV